MNPELVISTAEIIDLDSGDGRPTLACSRCTACAALDYPPREWCTTCGATSTRIAAGRRGVLYSVTAVRVRAPFGLPSPYWVAYLDLDEHPLRVFVLLDAEGAPYSIGERVELHVGPLGCDEHGNPCLRPFFSRCGAARPE